MSEVMEMVNKLSDSESVMAAQELFDTVFTEIDYDAMVKNSTEFPELQDILKIDDSKLESDLSASESIQLSRIVLQNFAANPGLAPAVTDACEKVKKQDDLFVGAILAFGLVVNLTLLIASTSVSIEKGPDGVIWKIEKAKSTQEVIKATIESITKFATSGSI